MKLLKKWFVLLIFLSFSGQSYAEDMFVYWDIPLPNKFIKEIQESKNYVWIGTAKGLARYDKRSKKIQTYNAASGLPDDFVGTIAVDSNEQTVWIGTPSGLAQLDLASGKIDTYSKKNSKLSDNQISTLHLFKNNLFIGTPFGVDIYNIPANKWKAYTSIEGLAGGNIQYLTSDGFYVWAGGADGISYYDQNEDAWYAFGADNGLNSSLVTSLVVNTDVVWVGTMGGGIARFDRATMRFDPYTTEEGLIDDNIQDLMDDGKYLWIATFGGLSRMDKTSLVFMNYDSRKGLTEASVTAGKIQGDVLYCGTEGGGLFTLAKSVPQITFLPEYTGYSKKGEIELHASVLSKETIKRLDVYYKLIATPEEFDYANVNTPVKWAEVKDTSAAKSENAKIATLRTTDWQDGKYLIRAEIEDSNGNLNEATTVIIVDNKPPHMDILFRPPGEGEKSAVVSGSYKELNLGKLEVKIGNKQIIPEINRQTRRFHFNYPLDSPDKIFITAEDIGKNVYSIEREFINDRDPPQIEVNPVDVGKIKSNVVEITGTLKEANIDRIVILPDNVVAELTPTGPDTYTFKAKAEVKKEGKYVYQITANDKLGNSAVKTLEIDFVSKISIVDIHKDKIPEFTLKDTFELSGNVLGPSLKEFYLQDKIRDRKYDIIVEKNKSFSITVPLKDGKNEFELVKIFNDDHKEEDLIKVESSTGKVKAYLDLVTNSYREKVNAIRGHFERGVKKVLINDKAIEFNKNENNFSTDIVLKDGKNILVLSWLDELNRLEKKEYTMFLDTSPPVLYVRALPEKTSLRTITIKGTVSDNVAAAISGYPNVEIQKLDTQSGEFEAVVKLENGGNNVYFSALDPAGNKKEAMFHVDVDKTYPEKQVKEGALSGEVDHLRSELERLRRELKDRPTVATPIQSDNTLTRVKLPETPGLFFVPMAGKIKSFSLTAKMYLGNELLGDVLSQFNGTDPREMTRILIPTPQLFSLIDNSKNRTDTEKIIRRTAQSFHIHANVSYIRKSVLQYLLRAGLFKETLDLGHYSLFLTSYGSGIIISGGEALNGVKIKAANGLGELLVGQVTGQGIRFTRY